MSSQILSVFASYQKARLGFAQQVAELSGRPQTHEYLQSAGVLLLLRPLLEDKVASVQQTACLALSRLAATKAMADQILSLDIVPLLIASLKSSARALASQDESRSGTQNSSLALQSSRHLKKACAYVLRAVAKHGEEASLALVAAGAVEALNCSLQEFDPQVKEAAVWALGYIATHSATLAQSLQDCGSIDLLVLCLQEPELGLKRVAVSALADTSKHSGSLAQAVVDSGALKMVAACLTHSDSKLRRLSAHTLAQVAKHTVDIAEVVVDLEVLPQTMVLMQDDDQGVRKAASSLLREVCKHSVELARLVVNSGGVVSLVDLVSSEITEAGLVLNSTKLPAIMALGYIAAFSETLAATIIASHALEALKGFLVAGDVFDQEHKSDVLLDASESKEQLLVDEEHYVAAAVWTIGQIGRHSTSHSEACCENDLPRLLLGLYLNEKLCEDLRTKAKKALNSILEKCIHLPVLQQLLRLAGQSGRVKVVKVILRQLGKVLSNDKEGKREFIQSGSLQFVQEIEAKLAEEQLIEVSAEIEEINQCFPPEIVDYYSPKHADKLMKLIDEQDVETKM